MSVFARVPIRLRLTLAFGVVMATVLVATGLFLYARLGAGLDETIDQSLRGRADDVAALVQQADSGLREGAGERLAPQGESFAQVIDRAGTIVDSTPRLGDRPLLDDAELARAMATTLVLDMPGVLGSDEPVRLLATPVDAQGERLVVVVGASLESRVETQESLLTLLLVGGPIVLVLASLAAYGLAAAALQPVESMRREAEAVSAAEPGRRLPLPPAEDEVRRLGETLNGMLGRLESALARERRFVADASHELRTPLAALRTELELALRRGRTPQELEAAVRSAADETERLSQLAEDLLVLARSHDGRLPVRRETITVGALFSDVSQRYARRAQEMGRPLEIQMHQPLEISADRLRLEQALGNLIENALRHGAGRIVLRASRHGRRIQLHVHDDGPGFAPDFVEHAFEPFSRGDQARSRSGAGLGLTIVDVIARAHGGTAHVSNLPTGADAWIELPDGLQSATGDQEQTLPRPPVDSPQREAAVTP